MHRPDEALGYYEQARGMAGADAELLNNLAIVLQDLGRIRAAIECYDAAISLQPDFPLAIWHRSLAYLLQHDFQRGWHDYELRSISKDWPPVPSHYPQWDGTDLKDRTILVLAEQGLGDEIMFASCVPDLIASCRHCVVGCSAKLEGLFQRSFPTATVCRVPPSRELPPVVRERSADVQVAMGSLPLHLRRNREQFPRHAGYLRADPAKVELWRDRLAQLGDGLKVGISWQGGTVKTRQQVRSVPLLRWLPILRTGGCILSTCSIRTVARSSQIWKRSRWRQNKRTGGKCATIMNTRRRWYPHSDLVISVCTAVIHLTGALGKPVWIRATIQSRMALWHCW
jgi:hypothetical protein